MHARIKSLFAIYFIFFIDSLGVAVVYPLIGPLILNPEQHLVNPAYSSLILNTLIASMIGIFPIAQFFGAPLWGDLADQYGRKKIFYYTICGTIVGYIFSAWALEISSYSLLFFSRLITGFFAGNLSLCLSSIADLSPIDKQRAQNYGLIATAGGLSWVVGIILGGESLTAGHLTPSTPFWMTTALSILSLIALKALYKETHPIKKKQHLDLLKAVHHILETLQNRSLRLLYLILFFWILGWAITIQWFASYATEQYKVSESLIILALGALGIAWGLGGSLTNKLLLKKLQLKQIVMIGLSTAAILIIMAGFSPNYIIFASLYVLASHFGALAWSNILNLISISAPVDVQGRTMGLGQSMISLAQLTAPLLGGLLASTILHLLYVVAGIFIFIALILLISALILRPNLSKD